MRNLLIKRMPDSENRGVLAEQGQGLMWGNLSNGGGLQRKTRRENAGASGRRFGYCKILE